jgi:hypothetical protein
VRFSLKIYQKKENNYNHTEKILTNIIIINYKEIN